MLDHDIHNHEPVSDLYSVEYSDPMRDYESQGNQPRPWLRAIAVSLCIWAVLIGGVLWLVGAI